MSDLFLLSKAQMARISPHFPLAHGVPRVDDRRVVSGIIYVIRNGLQWKDAPKRYGPHKTLYNRFIRWSRLGVFGSLCCCDCCRRNAGKFSLDGECSNANIKSGILGHGRHFRGI